MATRSKPGGTQKSSKPISFRLDREAHVLLEQRAAELGVGSIHELACQYVTGILRGEKAGEPSSGSVAHQLAELREDLRLSVETLLASAGKVKESDARRWADENLGT